jgi:RNA polymerase sigma-70 factor (ECF subfamily)
VFKHLSNLQEESKLSAWVKKIISNELRSAHRARSSLAKSKQISDLDDLKEGAEFEDSIPDPRSLATLKLPDREKSDLVGFLVEAIETLAPPHRQVINLDLEGYSIKEIAEEVGAREGAVKSRLHKVRNNLRKKILGRVSEPQREILDRYNR